MFDKRISLFSGHYGSGKTNVAVNYALALRKLKSKVAIYDLDIVNPYFRTVDAGKRLADGGVELIVSPFAETNVDIPAMNAASYKMVDDLSAYAVVDLGGDDRGALALGRFSEKIKEQKDYAMYLVLNVYRPETRDVNGLAEIKNEIERVAGIKFTHVVNDSNLGTETTIETIVDGEKKAREFAKALNLPLAFTAVEKRFSSEAEKNIKNILPIELIKYGDWL